jgi:hypothetical protein
MEMGPLRSFSERWIMQDRLLVPLSSYLSSVRYAADPPESFHIRIIFVVQTGLVGLFTFGKKRRKWAALEFRNPLYNFLASFHFQGLIII